VLTALMLCLLAAEEPQLETPLELGRWHFAAIPIASYSSDIGLLVGGALFFYAPLPDHPDERDEATLSASFATRGPRSLDTSWSKRRILGTPLGSMVNLHLGDDALMPYWGEGARLGGLGVPAGYGTPPAPYRYHDRRLFLAATLRGPIAGAFGWHVRARYLYVGVPEESALLAASAPPGARGGRVALGEAGLFYDTRDRDVGTRAGAFLSAALFAAPQLGGVSDFAFHGYDATARLYLPLGLGATLALRALYDRKLSGVPGRGDAERAVPFFERTLYEGLTYGEGMGGAATVRGVARYRFAGDEKALGNAQLRLNLFTSHLAGKMQEYGLSAGIDAAWARQPGFDAVDGIGAALGVRFIWDRAILFRVEMGRAPGGDDTLYVAFGEQF
jgi:hypothetical protein